MSITRGFVNKAKYTHMFRVNAENVSNTLKMEAMSQSQLVFLAHSTIECADARSAIECVYKWVGKDPAPPTLVSK